MGRRPFDPHSPSSIRQAFERLEDEIDRLRNRHVLKGSDDMKIQIEDGAVVNVSTLETEELVEQGKETGARIKAIEQTITRTPDYGPQLAALSDTMLRLLDQVHRMETVMAKSFSDINATLAAIDGVTNELSSNVSKVVASEAAQLALIQSLKDQVASGGVITQEQLDQLGEGVEARRAALETIGQNLKAIAADASDPAPTPDPVDVPDSEDTGSGGVDETGGGGTVDEGGGGGGTPESGRRGKR